MLSFWIHLVAFFQVVVMNCIQPVNWKYCYRVDQWLIPDLVEGYEIWTQKKHPYQNEKDYLRKVKQIGDCSNLENCRGVKALGSSTLPPSVSVITNTEKILRNSVSSIYTYMEIPK